MRVALCILALVSCTRTPPAPLEDRAVPSATVAIEKDAGAIVDAGPPILREEDWETTYGKWKFEDGVATSESAATMFLKRDHPMDFDLTVEIEFLTTESSAGIVFREKDGTYYQFEQYTRGDHHDRRLSLMVKNPFWVQIVTPLTREPPLREWIPFRVRARGDHIECFVKDELVFDKHDSTYLREGRMGIHVFKPRSVKIRKFAWTALTP